MTRRILLLLLIAFALPAAAQTVGSWQNWCVAGGIAVNVSGIQSTNPVQGSYPNCQVQVFLTGTTNPATIYSSLTLAPLASTFCANADGSFLFYASTAAQYDVVISNANACNPPPAAQLPAPFTFHQVSVSGSGGGGGGGGTSTLVTEPVYFVNQPANTPVFLATTFNTPVLLTECWDSNGYRIWGYAEHVDPVTFVASFSFSAIQSGFCLAAGGVTSITPPPSGVFSCAPTALQFGNVAIGTISAPSTVTCANNSLVPVTTLAIPTPTGTNAADFSTILTTTSPCGASLAVGASCTFQSQFTPTLLTQETATITVSSSQPNQTVSLSGTGFNGSGLTINPTSLTFGTFSIGTEAPLLTLTLTNAGTSPVTFTSFTVTGTNPGDFGQTNNCPPSLPQTQTCLVFVSFDPTATGARSATLSIASNALGSPQAVALSGTGAPNNVSITSMAISPTNPTITLPGTEQFTGTATLSDSSTQITPSLPANWRASGASGNASWSGKINPKVNNCNATTCAVAAWAPASTSNAILVFEDVKSTAAHPTAPTDTQVNVYTLAGTFQIGNDYVAAYWAIASATSSNTITCNQSSAQNQFIQCTALEVAGNALSNIIDAVGFSAQPGAATAAISLTAQPLVTTGTSDLVICTGWDSAGAGTFTVGNGYTSVVADTFRSLAEEILGAGPGSYACPMTDAHATTSWVEMGIAIKNSGGGPGNATINSSGLATAQAIGSSTITVAEGVYQQANVTALNSNATVITINYLNAQQPGDLNLVIIGWNDTSGQTFTVADSSGNSYTQIGSTIAANSLSQAFYYSNGIVAAAANNVVTVTASAPLTTPTVTILEYTIGVPGGSVLDAHVTGSGTSTCGTAITTVAPPSLIVSACTADNTLSAAPSPLVARVGPLVSGVNTEIADNVGTSSMFAVAGAQTTTIPVASSGHYVNSTVSFKAVNASTTLTISGGSINTFYVDPVNGNDSSAGTSVGAAWLTLCKANTSATLGTNGTLINLLPGTFFLSAQGSCYSGGGGLLLTLNGTSTQRVVWQGQNDPRNSANSTILTNGNGIGIYVNSNYTDFIQLEITGATLEFGSNDNLNTHGNNDSLQKSYLHDTYNTCASNNATAAQFVTSYSSTNGLIDSNVFNNMGVMGGCPGQSGPGAHELYVAGYHYTVTNNLVSNAQAYGMQFYHNACENLIANNTVVHNYGAGLLVSGGPNSSSGCSTNIGNYHTLDNNLVAFNGWGCGVVASGNNPGIVGGIVIYNTGGGAVNNVGDNNYLISNWTVRSGGGCTSSPGTNNSFNYSFSGQFIGDPSTTVGLLSAGSNFVNSCSTSILGGSQGSGGSSPSCNVIPLARGGNLDWHLPKGSTFLGAGGSGCAGAPGFTAPCVPTYDFDSILRASPTSVGAYD